MANAETPNFKNPIRNADKEEDSIVSLAKKSRLSHDLDLDAQDRLIFEMLVKHSLWPTKSSGLLCSLCNVELISVESNLLHVIGDQHISKLLAEGNKFEEKGMSWNMCINVASCEDDLKQISATTDNEKLGRCIKILVDAKKTEFFRKFFSSEGKLIKPESLDYCHLMQKFKKWIKTCNTIKNLSDSDKYQCHACEVILPPKPRQFLTHITDKLHLDKACDGIDKDARVKKVRKLSKELRGCQEKLKVEKLETESVRREIMIALESAQFHLARFELPILVQEEKKKYLYDSNGENPIEDIFYERESSDTDDSQGKKYNDSFDSTLECIVQDCAGEDVFDVYFGRQRFICDLCEDRFYSHLGIDQLQHLISFQHLSGVVSKYDEKRCERGYPLISEKQNKIEMIFFALEKMETTELDVISYLKRKDVYFKMVGIGKVVKDEIQFIKDFVKDFWKFVSSVYSDFGEERDEVKALRKICDPSFANQSENVQELKSHFEEFHERLSRFPLEVFKEEVKEIVTLLEKGMQETSQI